jgi:acyl transferase domain-containing protein
MARLSFADTPLAVIGMACRLPGAENLEQYWQLLLDGRSAIGELPSDRLDMELHFHPDKGVPYKTYSRLGGWVPDRPFDRRRCPISDDLIASSDPVHLAMLEVAADAFRHAGLDPFALPRRNTGVFVGHARGGDLVGELIYSTHAEELVQDHLRHVEAFARLAPELREAIGRELVHRVHQTKPSHRNGARHIETSAAAWLVATAFGLTGPCMAVDAACASSLFALQLATTALHEGRVDMALVGAASYSSWQQLILFSHAQALSAKGSFPFDERADGFINSDGYAAVLVKTLPRALADGDPIWGLLRGLGISCDGRGKSLWAPRKEGQVEAIHRAYRHGLEAGRVQYVEAHGTSTQLGDATEVDALATALGDRWPAGTRIPIGSSKANIGHTRETAGLAGLIKTLLAMRHAVIPPAANYQTPNRTIDWERVPFFLPTAPRPWPAHADGHPRRAAIDSFGIGGLNAHLVVDEFVPEHASAVSVPSAPHSREAGAVVSAADTAVAIIGVGAIFAGARTAAEFWDLLASGRDPKTTVPADRWNAGVFFEPDSHRAWRSPSTQGGFVSEFVYDWRTHKIPPRQLEAADPLQFMLLDAADQAVRDAGYGTKAFDRSRTGVVVGTMFGGDSAGRLNIALHLPAFERELRGVLRAHGVAEPQADTIVEVFREHVLERNQTFHDDTGSYISSTLASRIARTLDLRGGAFAVDSEEASSMSSLCAAVDLLLSGACDLVLCAGGQRAMDIAVYEVYSVRGLLAPGAPRPAFEAEANGFVPGEGAGVLLLKRLGDADRDGDRIRAVIRGIGAAWDSRSLGGSMRTAIDRGVERAGIARTEVSVVETSGTGVRAIDEEEIAALVAAYGTEPRPAPLLIGSLASQIGHTLGASGMASLLKVVLAFQNGVLPPAPRPAALAPALAARDGVLRPVSERVVLDSATPVLAGITSLGLHGMAYHVLLERWRKPQPATTRIVRIGSPSRAALLERVAQAPAQAPALYAAAGISRFGPDDRARLAVVAPSVEALERKLALAATQLAEPSAYPVLQEQGIYVGEAAAPPRVAFAFSGQGSQYVGMLRDVVREVPAAAAMLREADATMARLGYPSFATLAWEGGDISADVWRTQASILLADSIMLAALTAMGVRPDVVTGHSYGEYPALVAAGAWTLEEALTVTRARCRLIEAHGAEGVMLATSAPRAVVEAAVDQVAGVHIANHNAPEQIVVAGRRDAVDELKSRLATAGFEGHLLAVPRPFHSPLMAGVKEPFRRVLDAARILPPRIPVLSSVTNSYVADPREIRRNLVEQMTEPVRYVELIERLWQDGVTVVVEVGPQQVLTRFHQRILAGTGAAIIASDNPRAPGSSQLDRVQALLDCASAPTAGADAEREWEARRARTAGSRAGGASGGPIVHFDATERRRQKMRQLAESRPTRRRDSTPAPAEAEPADEWTTVLIDFVCEQTGYPAEVVDLDADLEADLGIDSIKKAQLLGELRERFDIQIQMSDTLSLSDFPTLRHVLALLRDAVGAAAPPARVTRSAPPAPPVDAPAPSGSVTLVRCAGTPYEMGARHARVQREQIVAIMHQYARLFDQTPDNRPETLQSLLEMLPPWSAYFTPDGLEEMRGLADALEFPLEYVVAYNLAMYPEYVPGCAQFAVSARRNGPAGMLVGVNEDWPLAIVLPDCLTRVVQVRHPKDGIPHVLFSLSGQLGGLNGINASGVAVSSTLLLDRPWHREASPGLIQPEIVRTILTRAGDLEAAIEILSQAARMAAWALCISHHPTDRLAYVEYDGASIEIARDLDVVASTNHCLLHPPRAEPAAHSLCRFGRLQALLDAAAETGCSVAAAQAILRDRFDLARERETTHPTMNTLQRVDNQISIVMRPAGGELWVTPGPLARDDAERFYRLNVAELLAPVPAPGAPAKRASESALRPAAPAAVEDEDDLADREGRIMSRFVLRAVDAPLPDEPPRPLRGDGPALIVGAGETSQALKEALERLGVTAWMLDPRGPVSDRLAELDRHWSTRPALHLFLMTFADAPGDAPVPGWSPARAADVLLPFLVSQHWTRRLSEANLLGKATLAGVTRLGGDFGFLGDVVHADGGALTGLLKAIRREFDGLSVKVIDAPPGERPASVVEALLAELASAGPQTEIGYVRGLRRVVRAVPSRAPLTGKREIPHGGTWVVTGGARGITAVVARELGRRFGLTLHLLGTSPVPPADDRRRLSSAGAHDELRKSTVQEARRRGIDPAAWDEVRKSIEIQDTLRRLAEAGIRAAYHSCDVSDRDAVAAVLTEIRRVDGPIHGVIHGAGVEAAAHFHRKKPDLVTATLAAKVGGAAVLMELTRPDPLQYFVAFASVSGRFGGMGQTDYSLASDMLAKMIQWFRRERPTCASVAIHWPAWDEVGMAARPESKLALEVAGQRPMPPTEGVEHLIDELRAGAPEGEVLILDRPGVLDLDGIMPAARERRAHRRRRELVEASPLIDSVLEMSEGHRLIAEVLFDPASDPFLQDHLFQGIPLLPAVIGLESLAEAASILFEGQSVIGLRNVDIVNGLRFYSPRPQRARVKVVQTAEGAACELSAAFHGRDGRLVAPERVHVTGVAELASIAAPIDIPRPEPASLEWLPMQYPQDPQERGVLHGPRLRCLDAVALGATEAWGRITAPELTDIGGGRGKNWIIPAAVLDASLVVCGVFARMVLAVNQLPRGFGALRIGRLPRPGETCTVHATFLEEIHQMSRFDFIVYGDDEAVILYAEGHRCTIVS